MQEETFEKVLHRYESMIKKQLISLNIYKNHDEFFQIGRIALWEACLRYDPNKGNFSSFAYVTVRGKMLEHLRKENRYEQRNRLTMEMKQLDRPDRQAENMLDKEIFLSYLAPLSEKQKIWAKESIVNQKTPSEIAREYGTSAEAVKSWRKEALKTLRKKAEL